MTPLRFDFERDDSPPRGHILPDLAHAGYRFELGPVEASFSQRWE
jgi:hypothetical protein